MSLLYKDKKDIIYKVDIKQIDDKIEFHFHANCGKFGTDEPLDSYSLSVERLLTILQDRDDYYESELLP